MTAWWTDMSITANTMRVRRQPPLRLQCLLQRLRRCAAVSAAKPSPSRRGFDGKLNIGDHVISLRNLCTGLAPVHFFRKLGAAATLAGLLAAAPVAPAVADPAPPQPAAVSPVGQSVADFYRARHGAPLWLSPAAGDAAQELVALLGSAALDGLDPN